MLWERWRQPKSERAIAKSLRKLKSPFSSASVRRLAAKNLGDSRDPRAVEPLICILLDESEHSFVREIVAKILGQIGDKRAIDPLVRASKSLSTLYGFPPHEIVEALWALLDMEDARSVPTLLDLLAVCNNPTIDAWRQIVRALGKLRDARAVLPLVTFLRYPNWDVRVIAAEALGRIGDSRAVKPLLTAFQETSDKYLDNYKREELVKALQQIADTESIPLLLTVLYETYAKGILQVLDTLGWRPADDMQRGLRAITLHQWDEVEQLGETVVELLIRMLNHKSSYSWFADSAIYSLGRIGDVRAVQPLLKILITSSECGPFETARIAAEALGQIGDSRAVKPLLTALKRKDVQLAVAAAEALGQIGDSRAVKPLLEALKDEAWRVQKAAGQALVSFGKTAVESLLWIVNEPTSSYAAFHAAVALAQIGDVRAVGALVEYTRDTEVAEAAVSALLQVLESSAPSIATEELHAITSLSNQLVQIKYVYDWDVRDKSAYDTPVDCRPVKQLAQQELLRRQVTGRKLGADSA